MIPRKGRAMKRKYTETEKKAFRTFADSHAPKSDLLRDCLWAFFVGGAICCIGQGFYELYISLGALESTAKILVPITLVLVSCILTGFGIYEKIAAKAGAGTLVPITGFANAVCSCAVDSKPEGFIQGVGTAIFTIAGPVIVYGTVAGWVYGVIYWITQVLL